ncbi:MAG: carbon starvation protein A [Bacteroidetes bacterium]|nr:carbon starvation protein A [Bacteroidota bacterium]
MNSLLLAALCFILYLLAYKTYGKFLSQKIFKLQKDALCPSIEYRDGSDFVPTKKSILFGHHFTSIAGLGPIVGPAIAIIWGWVPAVLWVVFGSIFMGAVHDLGVLIVSMRNKGRSIGDVAADLISPRVRIMFFIIMFLANLMVIAVFTLIIAILFNMYPSSVIPIWGEVPIAVFLGYMIYKKKRNHTVWSVIAVVVMYILVLVGAYYPISLPDIFGLNPLVLWAIVLLIYAYIASTLPVSTLLQPRDYINGHQLLVALALLIIGVAVASPEMVAPAINASPEGAPAMIPFLFIIIACGAISGFHSLVSGGTTSKQCSNEMDAYSIGYGSMLLEGVLALLVIIAVGAGVGMGMKGNDGELLTGVSAFTSHYSSWATASGLGAKLKAFVEGSANLMGSFGIPSQISITIMGVFIVSFAATTLDSATRVQRYLVSEFAKTVNLPSLSKPHPATLIAVGITALLCFHGGFTEPALKKGALALWPLFGVMNQLLATLALFAVTVYLARRKVKISYTLIPAIIMGVITFWASVENINTFFSGGNLLLSGISLISFILEVWIIIESIKIIRKISFTPV